MKPATSRRFDQLRLQTEVDRVRLRDDDPLCARQAALQAHIKEPLHLLGDPAHGLDIAKLIDGPRHGDILPHRHPRQRCEDRCQLGS
jgi:hypothetical protein